MKKLSLSKAALLGVCSFGACAQTDAYITLASDYSNMGISQNDRSPAVLLGFDHLGDDGQPFGLWTSMVDFSDGGNQEVNGYLGYRFEFHNLSLIMKLD